MTCVLGGVLAATLAGCVPANTRADNASMNRPAASSVNADADWAWDVSGDNAIRPTQVFSLGGKTYLQMRVGQIVPAVIVDGQPVSFTIAAPYIVLQGQPPRIDLLARGYRAVLLHRGPVKAPPTIAPNRVERVGTGDTASSPAETFPVAETRTVVRAPTVDAARTPVVAAPAQTRVWRITPDQRLLSSAIEHWSREAGIRLVWKSRVDVPITGTAEYHDGSFLEAMSHALADASGGGYRFFFSLTDDKTITVVAVRAS